MTDSCEEHTEQLRSLRYNSSVHCKKEAKSSLFLTRLDIEKQNMVKKTPILESHTSPTSLVSCLSSPDPQLGSPPERFGGSSKWPTLHWSFGCIFSCDPRWVYCEKKQKNRTNLKKFDWLLGWSDPQLIWFYISYGQVSVFFCTFTCHYQNLPTKKNNLTKIKMSL